MDSCSATSPATRAAAEGSKSHRTAHSFSKPFLLLHAPATAVASKSRKPSASTSKSSARLYPPTSKIPAPPGKHSEKKADMEPAVILSPKSEENCASRDEAMRTEKAVFKDEACHDKKALVVDEDLQVEKAGIENEALKEEKAVSEDEALGTVKAVAKDGPWSEEMTVYIEEDLRKSCIQRDASPLEEIRQNGISEKEKIKGHDRTENKDAPAEKEEKKGDRAETSVTDDSLVATNTQEDGVPFDQIEKDAVSLVLEKGDTDTENALTNFLEVPAQQDPSSPVAETKTIVHSEQNPKFSAYAGQTVSGYLKQMEGELDVKHCGHTLIFTEHLDSEQEGFLFAKGEPIFKESIQSSESESLPAAECSTLNKFMDQDVSSLSQFMEQDVSSLCQFETAVIAASDLKAAPTATVLDVACNGISSMPSSEDTGFVEAAMIALAKDVLVKRPAMELVQLTPVARPGLSSPWKLSRRALFVPSLVLLALLCLLCFASAVTQEEGSYLHPT